MTVKDIRSIYQELRRRDVHAFVEVSVDTEKRLMPSADRVPKASRRLVSDDRETQDDAEECIHHTEKSGVDAKDASNIRRDRSRCEECIHHTRSQGGPTGYFNERDDGRLPHRCTEKTTDNGKTLDTGRMLITCYGAGPGD